MRSKGASILFAVLFLGAAFYFVHNNTPSSHDFSSTQDLDNSGIVPSDKATPLNTTKSEGANQNRGVQSAQGLPTDIQGKITRLREKVSRQVNQEKTTNDNFEFLAGRELVSLQAIEKSKYQTNMGEIIGNAGGYHVLATEPAQNLLTHFDGVNKPVVTQKGKYHFGVVTGEIIIEFQKKTVDMKELAYDYQLHLVAQVPSASRGIFTPKSFPANLVSIASGLKMNPNVKNVEISVVEGGRVPH